MDIFSNFGLLGCFISMGGSVDTLMKYLDFMEDMWMFSDYLNVMMRKYDGLIKYLFLMFKYIEIDV